jgi:hypothetical protein
MQRSNLSKMSPEEINEIVRRLIDAKVEEAIRSQEQDIVSNLSKEIIRRLSFELERQIKNLLLEYLNSDLIPRLQHRITNDVTEEIFDQVIYKLMFKDRPNYQIAPPDTGNTRAKDTLKDILGGATSILVTDPFFFHVPGEINVEMYVAEILEVLPLSSLKQLTIIYSKPKGTTAINLFKDALPSSISMKLVSDSSIHDRIWVVNEKKAYLVGTSFGGLGKKYSFILPLPKKDLIEFRKWISKRLEAKVKTAS